MTDIKAAAKALADGYIRRNPVCSVQFKAFCDSEIRRGADYRYEADFDRIFPESKTGDTAEAEGIYVSDADGEIGLRLTPYGRAEVRVNGETIYKTDIFSEREIGFEKVITAKVKKGKNVFSFIFKKTPPGFGGKFGTHIAKWDYIFLFPDGSEGLRYRLNGGSWLPAKKEAEPENLGGGYALFYTKTRDGDDVFLQKNSLVFPPDGDYVNPFGVESVGSWAVLAPLHREYNEIDPLKIYENTYWRFKYDKLWLRPYYGESCYGKWNYPLGVTMQGLMDCYEASGDEKIARYVKGHMEMCKATFDYAMWDKERHGGAASLHNLLASIDSLDDCGSFAAAMLESKLRFGGEYGEIINYVADYISHGQPRTKEGAFKRENQLHFFHNGTMWADDLYMSVPFLARLALETGDDKYISDAANQFMCYEKYLRMDNGLMSHVFDLRRGYKTGVAWGRGNGWCIYSLSELLLRMKKTHKMRGEAERLFKSLAETYLKYQSPSGMWRQVIDESDSYTETSVTAMMTASFMRGVRMGLLGEEYEAAALRAAQATVNERIDEEGNLSGVCRGSEFSFSSDYYKYDLLPRENDNHGIGIVLTALCEVLKGV